MSKSLFESFPAPFDAVREYTLQYKRTVASRGHYLSRMIFYFLWYSARLMTFNGAYRFGRVIGGLFYRFSLRRHVAMTNLEIAFGDSKTAAEKESIYRESLLNFGQVVVNWLRLPFYDEAFWSQHVKITNEGALQQVMNEKKGCLLLAGHIGMWDLAGGKVGMSGYPVSVVARRIKNSFLDRWVIDTRCRMNFGSIQNKESMNRITEGLSRGEAIAMAIDQSMQPKQGVFIDWMGRTASSVRSAAYVVQKTGVSVLTGHMIQHGPKSFELILGDPIAWENHNDPEQELLINTQKQSDAIQQVILKHPGHWFWIHKRWKVQPEGTDNPYKK